MGFFKNYGILGQNARNLDYIMKYNDSQDKKLADSKLKTKEFLSKKGVKVSQTLAVIKNHKELDNFDISSLPLPFVVKPNAGYGGKGIVVFEQQDSEGNYITNDKEVFTPAKLEEHFRDILDGFFSLSGSRDRIIFERKLVLDHSIELLGKYGLPDIRVIVFNKIPVIAMLRVPTENSKGKANLHGGACGLGVDIGTGKITYMTQFKKMIKSIPGIGDVRGIEIPKWEEVLKLAVKVQQVTGVGYVGCDIVLDEQFGPLLLEMNVRPGLEVQVANKIPLLERLKKVENIKVDSIAKGVRLARDLFGGDIEEKIKNISGKKVVGNKEYVEILFGEKKIQTVTETKGNKPNSYINKDYLLHTLKYPEEKIKDEKVKLKCNILGEIRNVRFVVKDLEVSNMILGKEALYGFLIDPFKYRENDLPFNYKNPLLKEKNIAILKGYEEILQNIDKNLIKIDKKLNMLKILTPNNTQSERLKFIEGEGKYIPKFTYNDLSFSPDELLKELENIEIPEIPLSSLYNRKALEIKNKLLFCKAFKKQNISEMNFYVSEIFGKIIPENLDYAISFLEKQGETQKEKEFLSFDEIAKYIKNFNHIYNINISLQEKEHGARFSIKGNTLFLKRGALVGKREIRSIIAHEIEGHYLRRVNGQKQKYTIFHTGTAGYLQTEEGLAIYNQMKFLSKHDKKYISTPSRYVFIHSMIQGDYRDFIDKLEELYDKDYSRIFKYLQRFKRGVCDVSKEYFFTKDVVYLNGYLEVKKFVEQGGDIRELYFGKIGVGDLEEIKKSEILFVKTDDFVIPLFI